MGSSTGCGTPRETVFAGALPQGLTLEPLLAERARERMLAPLKKGEATPAVENLPERGRTRDQLGEIAGLSGRTI